MLKALEWPRLGRQAEAFHSTTSAFHATQICKILKSAIKISLRNATSHRLSEVTFGPEDSTILNNCVFYWRCVDKIYRWMKEKECSVCPNFIRELFSDCLFCLNEENSALLRTRWLVKSDRKHDDVDDMAIVLGRMIS